MYLYRPIEIKIGSLFLFFCGIVQRNLKNDQQKGIVMIRFFYHKPHTLQLVALFLITFIIRALVLEYAIIPEQRYRQADTPDYHVSALLIKNGHGMFRPDIKQPIFWRTPGYPFFLSLFYPKNQLNSSFELNAGAHKKSLWAQVVINSFIPIILLYLAYIITHSWLIAWITALISTVHIGLILASVYLLSEGAGLIFFYLFLLALFWLLQQNQPSLRLVIGTALLLGIHTWIRPMGEWIGIITIIIIACAFTIDAKKRIGAALLFGLVFFATLAPWYIRNYQYTHKLFFNPTVGTYVNCFCVPKILRRVHGIPLEKALTLAQQNAAYHIQQAREHLEPQGLFASQEECKKYALPLMMKYPHYVLYDWMAQCIKTSFDLYSHQLVSLAHKEHTWDPIEEFLDEKVTATLYKRPLHWSLRLIAWSELLMNLLMWIGLFWGIVGTLKDIILRRTTNQRLLYLWISATIIALFTIALTGGFGYARLRLPIEPLLIIFGLIPIVRYLSKNR
jgi:hypothetical protein